MSRGHDRERAVQDWLQARGWWVCRAAGSLGDADLVAMKRGFAILNGAYVFGGKLLIEVKSTAAGPFADFGPAKRVALLAAGEPAGADVVLCWWPPAQGKRTGPQWIWPDQWPEARRRAA